MEKDKKTKYVLDENGDELMGVIGFEKDGFIFNEEWLEKLIKKTKEENYDR